MLMHMFKVKYFSFLLFLVLTICALSCGRGKTVSSPNGISSEEVEAIKESVGSESLIFWTADTIVKMNPRLVSLMDTLYQYVSSEFFESDVNGNLQWMRKYRNQLCEYYKEYKCADCIPEFVIADSVLSEARVLWSIHTDDSNMGNIVNNDVECTRIIFEQFNEFDKLYSVCDNSEQRQILLHEFDEWLKLRGLFYKIYVNCVYLYYWGGSCCSAVSSGGALEIWSAHIDLYKSEYQFITKEEWKFDNRGSFLTPSRDFLISCVEKALVEYYYSNETGDEYKTLYEETKTIAKQLPSCIDSWCASRKPWEDEMCTDGTRSAYQRNTSGHLIKLASIISSI